VTATLPAVSSVPLGDVIIIKNNGTNPLTSVTVTAAPGDMIDNGHSVTLLAEGVSGGGEVMLVAGAAGQWDIISLTGGFLT
jgi:hypothetical protein